MGGVALRKFESLSELSRAHPSPEIQKYHTIQTMASTAPTLTKTTSTGISQTPTVGSRPPRRGAAEA